MNKVMHAGKGDNNAFELNFVRKAVVLMALLTGFLYLWVIIGDASAVFQLGSLPVKAILIIGFQVMAIAGLIMTWRWKGAGGLLAVLGGIGLMLADHTVFGRQGWFAALLYGSPFIVSGTLCMACWRQERQA